ncbi:Transmembrane protein 234 homolog [Geodia barretti]|uniref:Transmembrane protein 234 homolog n=1 Tax=Geodia barretti TaxID=519541 RepID=A0AA35T7A9_GEOBA|nr:Transmembrane protein 234 homolog [Geodia barretti]
MDFLSQTLSFLAVALVWGTTNPLLKKGSVGVEKIQCRGRLRQLFAELAFLALRWQYVVPFLVNQSGSVLYYVTIGQADISLAVPITNSLTFLVTSVAGRLMGEKSPTNTTYLGVVLVLVGVALCIASKLH